MWKLMGFKKGFSAEKNAGKEITSIMGRFFSGNSVNSNSLGATFIYSIMNLFVVHHIFVGPLPAMKLVWEALWTSNKC